MKKSKVPFSRTRGQKKARNNWAKFAIARGKNG